MKKKYKIRDIATGLYQDADFDARVSDVSWSSAGKTWQDVEQLKKHINLLQECRIMISPLWEVIELQGNQEERYPVMVLLATNKSKKRI